MFDISRMDLMWISFYSLGAMALAAVLIYVARYFLLMIPVLGGSSHA